MSKLPLKIRILEYAYQLNKAFTAEDVTRDLQAEYGREKQFNRKRVENYIQSFLGVKFFKEDKIEYDQNGQLLITCSITDYGKSRIKYIPQYNTTERATVPAEQF